MAKPIAIGIDLGTTNSCVAIVEKGIVTTIFLDDGVKIIPSCVAFSEFATMIGAEAKNYGMMYPDRCIYGVKRIIGKRFMDAEVQADIKRWPFTVVNDNSKPTIEVTINAETKTYHPEQISALVLQKMKDMAEEYLKNQKIKDVVITVPAHFSDAQKQATIDAGKIANLNVMKVITEPTAAALTYTLGQNIKETKTILVFDLGGGTFDVSILSTDGKNFNVICTDGNTHLGGDDFDNRLLDYVMEDFLRKNNVRKDINNDHKDKRQKRLLQMCEKAKRTLSVSKSTDIIIDMFLDNISLEITITRNDFERINEDLFKETVEIVGKAMNDVEYTKDQIDDIVLVGGSTRIPKIQELLSDFFDGKELKRNVSPDEAVAHGAAIQAALLMNNDSIPKLMISDVTPLSLGIEVEGGIMSVVIHKNTPIPCKHSETFTNPTNNPKSLRVAIYEGERTMVEDNNFLSHFDIFDIPKGNRGTIKVEVTFSVDVNGILDVYAKEQQTKRSECVRIAYNKGRLSKDEIEDMVKKAKHNADKDKASKERAEMKCRIQAYCYKISSISESLGNKLSEKRYKQFSEQYRDVLDWIENNEKCTKEALDKKYIEVTEMFKDIELL